jgi:RNA polymerase sigma factor (sigma-70 family)
LQQRAGVVGLVTEPWEAPTLALREARRGRPGWATTPPELLLRARALEPRAVAALFERYRPGLRKLFRRLGVRLDEVEDFTQGLVVRVLKGNSLSRVDPSRSFRSWLYSCALHQFYNERARRRTRKARLDDETSFELCEQLEGERDFTGERKLDQHRAKLLVDKAWARLRAAYVKMGDEELFEHLRKTLLQEACETSDAELCSRLGRSKSYVAVARYHLRNEEFPAAIMAELKQARLGGLRDPGGPRGPRGPTNTHASTLQADLQTLLDAIG